MRRHQLFFPWLILLCILSLGQILTMNITAFLSSVSSCSNHLTWGWSWGPSNTGSFLVHVSSDEYLVGTCWKSLALSFCAAVSFLILSHMSYSPLSLLRLSAISPNLVVCHPTLGLPLPAPWFGNSSSKRGNYRDYSICFLSLRES